MAQLEFPTKSMLTGGLRMMVSTAAVLFWIGCTAAAAAIESPQSTEDAPRERESIRPEAIRAHVEFLADDLLEGRGTGSRGNRLAANYLRAQCQAAGLRGAAEGGSFFQKISFVRTIVDQEETTLELKSASIQRNLVYEKEFAIIDTHRETQGAASGELVFAGFGVTAPEQGYDDYAGIDVKGKIVVLLSEEAPPAFPSAVRAFYSDHDYMRANASGHGAVGLLYIDSPAVQKRFPWAFTLRELKIGWNSIRWVAPNGAVGGLDDSLKICGLLSPSGAAVLFADEKYGLDQIFAAAGKGSPPHFAMSKSACVKFQSRHEKVESQNVVARLGSGPPHREYVLFSAHLDHLGIGEPIDGDGIYNGALDNATGCAVLLEIARAFAASREHMQRDLLFLFVTAEEAGLLGSDYFACHPTVPLDRIAAVINVDGGANLTPVSDMIAWGAEHSSLGRAVQEAASQTSFTVSPDPFPEEGIFVRSDQFSFVKKGIPSLLIDLGVKSTTSGIDALALLKEWMVTVYHSPKDDLSQPIDYVTSARLATCIYELGHAVALDPDPPRWNEADFFGSKFATRPR
ncbi:MAG: M20/M25/M40 family metallo-hydrolase [Verrucomicrobiia bacterium]